MKDSGQAKVACAFVVMRAGTGAEEGGGGGGGEGAARCTDVYLWPFFTSLQERTFMVTVANHLFSCRSILGVNAYFSLFKHSRYCTDRSR